MEENGNSSRSSIAMHGILRLYQDIEEKEDKLEEKIASQIKESTTKKDTIC